MKNLFLSLMLFSIPVFGQQNDDLKLLENRRENISRKIKNLQDSMNILEKNITAISLKQKIAGNKNVEIKVLLRKGAKMKFEPSFLSDDLKVFQEEISAVVYDYNDEYLKICAENDCGFVSTLWVISNPTIDKFISDKREIESYNRQRILAENKKKNKDLQKAEEIKLIKKFGQVKYDKLKQGYYWLGMTKEMALIAFGSPSEINESVGRWGNHQQWVYDNIYLYFEDDKLVSYQR